MLIFESGTTPGRALLGLFFVALMLAMVRFFDRGDRWLRENGFGRIMNGSRSSARAYYWFVTAVLCGLGLVFLVLFIKEVT